MDALIVKNNGAFIMESEFPFLMVELDAGLIQVLLQASEKAPSGFGTVGSPQCVKDSRDSQDHRITESLG